ncbi:MAG TPA: M56 family metallopeptidase, partial [Pirellulales bacterium]
MANESLLQALFAQAWQLAALSLVVAGCARYVARNRPHLAHALWLVVLLKCVTPPVWHSPIGVFSWLSPSGGETPSVEDASALAAASQASPGVFPVDDDGALGPADVTVDARAGAVPAASPIDLLAAPATADEEASIDSTPGWLGPAAVAIWATGVLAMAIVSAARFGACWRRLRRSEVETHFDLEALLARLSKTLRVRRAARLLVTNSRIGPAVIGLWRPTILLPACVVRGRTAAELEPIVAHELIHVRRGDLWVGLLQTVAQTLWWFHPLVWLAGRMISREAERCCDEEVIGELRCDPARYARSLLSVLEWKRILIPVPAAPGVRVVEITSQRLERIMTLGQGCRRRTPWWCWGAMLLAAALALPGSP